MHKEEKVKYSTDYKKALVRLYITHYIPMVDFCRLHGISREIFEKWYAAYCFDVRESIENKRRKG
ncbi:MAG: hypothetical protein PHT76_15545 [Anaerostipes sp.]|nr:hypothetical protein [Anaerostipes sp.]